MMVWGSLYLVLMMIIYLLRGDYCCVTLLILRCFRCLYDEHCFLALLEGRVIYVQRDECYDEGDDDDALELVC